MNEFAKQIIELCGGQPHSYMKWGNCDVIGITTSCELVDFLLLHNTHNRNPKPAQIRILKAEQEAGNWMQTAQGIGVDANGTIADGQNRLLANKFSGYPPIPLLIVCNLDPKAQAVVDQHARRSMADAMTMLMNVTVTTRVVASMNSLLCCEGLRVPGKVFSYNGDRSSPRMIAEMMAEWNDFLDIAGTTVLSAPIASTIASFAKFFDGEVARRFLDNLKSMTNLSENSPVLRLANVIKQTKVSNSASKLRLVGCTASAVKAYSEDRSMRMLKPVTSW